MRDTAADAKRDINAISKQVQDAIDTQQKALATFDARLERDSEELTKKFEDAKTDVSAKRQDFERFANELSPTQSKRQHRS